MSAVRISTDRLLSLAGAEVTHHTQRTASGTVHHIEAGSGKPVVLVHGGGGGCANWFRIIGPLSRHRRVLAPDLPGFGESSAAPLRGPLGGQAAEFLDDWLASVGVTSAADIIGTSFGGLAAMRFAQARRGRVKRLVLIDSVGLGAAVPSLVRMSALPLLGSVLLRPSRRGGEWLFDHLLTGGRAPLPADLRSALLEYLRACDAAGVAAQLKLALRRFTGLRGQHDVVTAAELQSLRVPVLLVWGERDRFVPVRHGRRAARELPDARLVTLPDAGHSPNWETPEPLLAALVEFLGIETADTA